MKAWRDAGGARAVYGLRFRSSLVNSLAARLHIDDTR